MVLGELPELAFLPELPDRGPGADLVGRGAGFLVDLPVELAVSGWRFCDRPGHDLWRTKDLLARDLDVFAEAAEGFEGVLKVQVPGPWTLAATVELRRGEKALSDPGAVQDLIDSLAEGVRGHVAELSRRVPSARILTQLDEPALPGVLTARIATASGFRTLRAIPAATVSAGLSRVIASAGAPVVVHCCAPEVPLELLRGTGVAAVAVDLGLAELNSTAVLDTLAEHLDAGTGLWVGVVPGTGLVSELPRAEALADRIRGLWQRLGLAPELLPEAVVLTPGCGLAGASSDYARAALRLCRTAARQILDDPES
jgi:methionine synthase II (cobalamin-independent)